MTTSITLHVTGTPASKGSGHNFKAGGYAPGRDAKSSARIKAWETAVADRCAEWRADHLDEPYLWVPIAEAVEVRIDFYFDAPQSDPHRRFHDTTIDIDKGLRSSFDGLVLGRILADDRYISRVLATKWYANATRSPGATIYIETLGEPAWREHRRAEAKAERARERQLAKLATTKGPT